MQEELLLFSFVVVGQEMDLVTAYIIENYESGLPNLIINVVFFFFN